MTNNNSTKNFPIYDNNNNNNNNQEKIKQKQKQNVAATIDETYRI